MDKARASTLHDIVVDYVINNAYAGTARVLAGTPAPGTPSASSSATPQEAGPQPSLMDQLAAARDKRRAEAMDVDDDTNGASNGASNGTNGATEPMSPAVLERLEQRREIIEHILSGSIGPAFEALNAHFPAVLLPVPATTTPRARVGASHATPVFARSTEPEHVALNLQIQQFIECFRQIVPSAPSSPTSSIGSLNGSSSAPLDAALNVLAQINTAASKLPSYPRSVYLQEFRDVGGLLAYTNPENSELAGFLDQARRVALAAQVNAAILHSEGRATQSYLEQIARRTSAIYETITDKDIDPQPVWAGTDAKGAGAAYRIAEQLKRRPFQKGGFNLHEYVWEMA